MKINYWVVPGLPAYLTKYLDPINVACEVFNVERDKLMSPRRYRELVQTRQVVMWYYHRHRGFSLNQTGRLFKKDHATVLHSCRVVENYLEYDKIFVRKVDEFLERIR